MRWFNLVFLSFFYVISDPSLLQAQDIQAMESKWNTLYYSTMGSRGDCDETRPPEVYIEKTADGIEILYENCGYTEETVLAESRLFSRITLPEYGFTGELGGPQLPAKGRYIEIPEGTDPVLEILEWEDEEVGVPYPIFPTQPIQNETEDPMGFVYRPHRYRMNDILGETPVVHEESGYMGTKRYALVRFIPVSHNPVTGHTRVTTKLRLLLKMQAALTPRASKILAEQFGMYLIIADNGVYENCNDPVRGTNLIDEFVNWKTQKGYYTRVVKTSNISEFDTNDPWSSYPAVYNQIKKTYENPLVELKYVLLVGGYPLIPSKQEDVGYYSDYEYSLVRGDDDWPDIYLGRIPADTGAACAAALSKILIYDRSPDTRGDWYNKSLLLSYFQDQEYIRDNAPCEIDEDCDKEDGFTCQEIDDKKLCRRSCDDANPCDGIQVCVKGYCNQPQDCVPERSYLDVTQSVHDFFDESTNRVTETVLSTSHFCEQDPEFGPDYGHKDNRDKVGDGHFIGEVSRYNKDSDFWSEGSRFEQSNDITNSINSGVGFVVHRDHGADSVFNRDRAIIWSQPYFNLYRIDSLTNGNRSPFVLSMNCSTGRMVDFDQNTQTEVLVRNVAEQFLSAERGGAVGIIAPTNVTSTSVNDLLLQGAIASIWHEYSLISGIDAPYNKMGAILSAMKQYQSEFSSNTSHRRMYHLYGDPELSYRDKTPGDYDKRFAHPAVLENGDTSIDVQMSTMYPFWSTEAPRISITQKNQNGEFEILGVSLMRSVSEEIDIVVPDQCGPIFLTITHNLMKPYQTEIGWDHDGDCVHDRQDNCPDIANPEQDDGDWDGIGDACDWDWLPGILTLVL